MADVGTNNQMALNPRDNRQMICDGIDQRPRGCSSAARGKKLGGHFGDEAEEKREGIKGLAELLDHEETVLWVP
jgi:hypothetical protein